jgi:hypothetical protein
VDTPRLGRPDITFDFSGHIGNGETPKDFCESEETKHREAKPEEAAHHPISRSFSELRPWMIAINGRFDVRAANRSHAAPTALLRFSID